MSIKSIKQLPVVLIVILMLGCTANNSYRSEFSRCSGQPDNIEQVCGKSSLQAVLNPQKSTGVDYLMGFVEFDDQGQS